MWSNFHSHSRFCDGKGELVAYCEHAAKLGIITLGFSSHAPLPFPCAWSMKPEMFPEYIHTIEALRGIYPELPIYKGLEVDFVPGYVSPSDFEDQLDYTIGSIHFVDAFPDGRPWEIDGLHTLFLEGLESIFNHDIQSAIQRYFELTRQMISTGCPSVIGHLDKIKIQNTGGQFFKESDSWYREEVEKTLDLIREAGCVLEVNTRGLYQKKSTTPYPSPWILELAFKKNIPITLSSDAHHPEDLINRFSETAEILRKIGFKTLSVLKEGLWKQFEFDTNGIILEHH